MKKGRTAMWAKLRTYATVLLGLELAAACGQTNTTESGETHFLLKCVKDGDCGDGLACLAGVCSRSCELSADCANLSETATCVDQVDGHGAMVCDVACTTLADCSHLGPTHHCQNDFCRARPAPTAEAAKAACDGGCEGAECATPGVCSLAAACDKVACDSSVIDAKACYRPICEGDGDCPESARCTPVQISHRAACREVAAACECSDGLGLVTERFCSPAALVGPRGTWTSFELTAPYQFIGTAMHTFHPDGSVERVVLSPMMSSGTAQMSAEDLAALQLIIDGDQLRAMLADPAPCPIGFDGDVHMRLVLDTTTLEKDVGYCPGLQERFGALLQLAQDY
jgi:hypothetical protein